MVAVDDSPKSITAINDLLPGNGCWFKDPPTDLFLKKNKKAEHDDVDVDDTADGTCGTADLPKLLFDHLLQDSASIVEKTAIEIGNITLGNREKCQEFYRIAGNGLMVMILLKWPYHEVIQAQCYRTLASVTNHVPEFRCALLSMGRCLDITVGSMKRFKQSPQVQLFGSSLIYNLLFLPPLDDNNQQKRSKDTTIISPHRQKRHFVERLDGVDLIVKVLQNFPNYAQIQVNCCKILCRLSESCDNKTPSSGELRDILANSNAVEVIQTALDGVAAGNEVHDVAFQFLNSFQNNNKNNNKK